MTSINPAAYPQLTAAPQYAMPPQQQLAMHPQAMYPQAMYQQLPQAQVPQYAAGVPGQQLPLAAAGPGYINPQAAQALYQQPMTTNPYSMPAGMAQGTLGAAAATNPPSKAGTIIKSVLKFGLLGAGAGAAIGLIPILPGSFVTGGLIGGAIGAIVGLVKGIKSANEAAVQQAGMPGAQQVPVDPNSVGNPVTVTPAAAPVVRKAAKKARKRKTYTVRSGDTLGAIAKRNKTTWQKIYAANKKAIGPNPSALRVGVRIVVPHPSTAKKD